MKLLGYVPDISKYHNVLCSKTYDTFDGLLWSPTGSRQAAKSARICEIRLLRCTWTKLQLASSKCETVSNISVYSIFPSILTILALISLYVVSNLCIHLMLVLDSLIVIPFH